MALTTINVGTTANDGTGDPLRTAFTTTNANFADIEAGLVPVVRPTAPATLKGVSGDTLGMIAFDATSIYVCTVTWTDGVADIWLKTDAVSIAHAADATLHFTEASIDHANITNVGTNNHAAIDTHIASAVSFSAAVPALPHGVAGDLAGMIAYDATYIYVCILDYVDDLTISWKRIALPAPAAAVTW